MSHRHLIRFLDDERAHWFALDRAGRVLSGPVEGLPAGHAEETIVLLPSSDVLLLEAPRVARQRRQLERAIPFAIEDQLVAPVEQAHVVVLDDSRLHAESTDADSVAVAVVAHERLRACLARLEAHGLQADRLWPEGSLLPYEDGLLLLLDGEQASLRHARSGLLAGRREEVADWLALLAAQGETRPLLIISDRPADRQAGAWHWPAGVQFLSAEPGRWLATRLGAWKSPQSDLLNGPYQPRHRGLGSKRTWAWAAGLAGAGIVLAALSMAQERWQLDRHHTAQRAQMETLLRENLPDVQRIVDPRAQMLGELSRRSGQAQTGGALTMLGRIAPLMSGSGRYTLDGFEYRSGTLDITVRGADVATLDELRERIGSLGYSTELTSMVPGSGGVEGKLRVRGGGA